jgi:branched-chain amino acid transport system ATP-binding protein
MTVLENLELGCYVKEARKYRDELLEMVFSIFPKLRERKKQLAGTLSGGEQQMLAIARALMTRPKLLMLDEPSLGLAPLFVEKIFQVLESLKKEGLTICLVEQMVRDALILSDRAYVLENGHVVLEGSGKELLDDDRVKKAYLSI